MLDMGFVPHLVKLIKSLYDDQRSNVGVYQGCSLSPYLFNIMAEVLMRLALEGFEDSFRIGGSE